jgi:hypothetical protein
VAARALETATVVPDPLAGAAAEDAAEVPAEEPLAPDPEPATDEPPMPLTAAHVPVSVPEAVDEPTTSGPGSGKTRSVCSTVVQPLPRFATNSPGRLE